ncbi:hypothetical protein Pcinc_019703 [Petrolisthes cinctipes]|uniref:Uncharacterized protein n=1 Tax=Petrolisthes cinctipes TaxID=88211 RepID=A0AAE1FKG5_PETCI|nr:hypothetical protein Pcinc_019703 [Petrolisthes cinctipes]
MHHRNTRSHTTRSNSHAPPCLSRPSTSTQPRTPRYELHVPPCLSHHHPPSQLTANLASLCLSLATTSSSPTLAHARHYLNSTHTLASPRVHTPWALDGTRPLPTAIRPALCRETNRAVARAGPPRHRLHQSTPRRAHPKPPYYDVQRLINDTSTQLCAPARTAPECTCTRVLPACSR